MGRRVAEVLVVSALKLCHPMVFGVGMVAENFSRHAYFAGDSCQERTVELAITSDQYHVVLKASAACDEGHAAQIRGHD
jgi:hypothetical protein